MRALALSLLASLPAAAASKADTAYESARKAYASLKADPAKRKFRHHWQNVAHKFEGLAQKYPKSPKVPDALFSAGQLLEGLSHLSRLPEDLDAAVIDYKRLCEAYPSHPLSEDAALALAKIDVDRLGRPVEARRVLTRALERYPKGEKAGQMRALLGSLSQEAQAEPEPVREPDSPKAKRHSGEAPRIQPEANGGELTLAQQLGLKVRRVVIDAGHGGHDTGAIGASGTREKDVTLALAKKVADLLQEQGLETFLTRDSDAFVRLEDRARIANDAKGDLFLSIHCNAAQNHALKGVETYTLNTSSDRYSIRLAARENSSSEKGLSDLQFILADLATKANTDESERLATKVQHALVHDLSAQYSGVTDLGTKQALFYVLLGAKMPAVLVETSFLSNPEEEHRLASRAYQEDVAQSIAQGVQSYLGSRERAALDEAPAGLSGALASLPHHP